ncbi:helix-turn-helix transcriptional regulator [Vogesella sp. XCS3]|uniref:helix-turn-helix transcriptional regulator n=1 Tax=Vogesella sp. XCS3 TaxID=2877939 RepID=UPI002102BBD8|nr:helix-turn-helix transcriptional regulator [Vogesella sp. XCS3]
MTQSDLAKALNTQQSAIARLEDPSYGKFTLKSIINIARFFDVSVSVEIVSFSTHLRRTANLQAETITPKSYLEEFDPSTGEPLCTLDLHHDKSVLCLTNYVTPVYIDNSVFVSGSSAQYTAVDKLFSF